MRLGCYLKQRGTVFGLALALTVVLISCDVSPSEPVSEEPVEVVVVSTAVIATKKPPQPPIQPPTPEVESEPMATILPPSEPAPTQSPEPTLEPTPTPRPSPTYSPPPPIGDIQQPAYLPSDCSDKYPCNDDVAAWENRIQVPDGFTAEYFTHIDGNPNAITFGPDSLLYVATMQGSILTVDENGTAVGYVDGFISPTGLGFQPGTDRLFVSSRVTNISTGGESQISVVENGEVQQLYGDLPCCYTLFHAANGIAFGPDGQGYVSVGARADHGEILDGPDAGQQDVLHPFEAAILHFDPAGGDLEVYARGFRNSYDIAWDGDGRLFATDNMPDFGPPEAFHLVTPDGEHGYPWYECEGCFRPPEGVVVIPPLHTFPPHSAPTGIVAYLGDHFPGYYNSLFATLWSAFPEAQRIIHFSPGGEEMTTWATGFAAPIDLTIGPDGHMYVADWATGIIFRISYTG